jgi:methyltransferase
VNPSGSPSIGYLVLVGAAVAAALLERVVSLRHEARLRRAGAPEVAPRIFRLMVPVYALAIPAAAAEHLWLGRRPPAVVALAMTLLFVAAKILKVWAIVHLGGAWTMRVFVPLDLKVATGGPYRFIRHPNYVAVTAEMLALPLAGGAWITAVVSLALFLPLLAARVRTEERALLARSEYAAAMADRRRFLPGGRR